LWSADNRWLHDLTIFGVEQKNSALFHPAIDGSGLGNGKMFEEETPKYATESRILMIKKQ
jgi:hypothetical protein